MRARAKRSDENEPHQKGLYAPTTRAQKVNNQQQSPEQQRQQHQSSPIVVSHRRPSDEKTNEVVATTTATNNTSSTATATATSTATARQLARENLVASSSSSSSSPSSSQIEDETNGEANSSNRLVFGLNSRANKIRHDEYAEKRRAKQQQSNPPVTPEQSVLTNSENNQPISNKSVAQNSLSSPKIRASKYGNFYRPQDLVTTNQLVISNQEPKKVLVRQRSSESPERRKVLTTAIDIEQRAPVLDSNQPADNLDKVELKQRRTPRREDKYKRQESPPQSSPVPTMATENSQPISKAATKQAQTNSNKQHMAATGESVSKQQTSAQPKMQFNIPPPPKVNSGSMTKSSIISYAKSRIYDKQQQQQQQQSQSKHAAAAASLVCNQINGVGDALLDSSNNIPESISSGFKPPKQVNVSKARERWEGGEPFAKCKSRQRLAQSANKKVLYGSWSMTSVVATQQMQFQQALSQSASSRSSFAATNQYDPDDTPVKILTRGSVLERVQQYERAPPSNLRSNNSAASGSGSLSSSTGSLTSSSSTPTSTSNSSTSSAAATIEDLASLSSQPNTTPSSTTIHDSPISSSSSSNNNKATSSISSSSTQIPSSTLSVSTPPQLKSPLPDQITAAALNRRFSYTRRRSSASSAIPKFYHPNGKPNTYEIELQKKNIVACFDKFTDRKALLTAPAYKRHFHSISLACGFSEYFKEPLYRYIKHQMTNSNLLHNPSPARKQSSCFGQSSPNMANGFSCANAVADSKQSGTTTTGTGTGTGTTTTTNGQSQKPRSASMLTRAASIDNSTVEKIQNQNYISCEQFLTCWRHLIGSCFDNPARFVHLLTLGQRNYLLPEDFVPLIQSIIDDHPGLKFLRTAPDFHMRYIQTVIARIYFCINRSWTGKISLCELRRSNLLQVLETLANEEDINQITDYFSYEHFYVIYCKFWSLDQDHDLLISKEDLARHNDASISSRIIDRIFTGVVSKRIQETGKMSYSDFVWFLIAEEDKKHPRSVEYWFRLMDIDGDGYISMYEMEYFYYEQTKRLEMMNIEPLPFLDSACQVLDLINPKEKSKISLSDLKKTKLATIFFDTFINLEKYLEHESREFVSTRDIVQNGQIVSDWDRYASEAYESLVTEESSV